MRRARRSRAVRLAAAVGLWAAAAGAGVIGAVPSAVADDPSPVTAALPIGSALVPQTSLATATGYRVVMQPDGNLVESGLGRVLWSSRTHVPGSHAVLQSDGNFVIYSPLGVPLWASHTAGQDSAGLLLTADGDLVMDSTTGSLLWDTQVSSNGLAPTGLLAGSQTITSPDGGTTLTMSPTGNVVLRTLVGTTWVTIWTSNTGGHPGAFLRMRADGNLVVLGAADTVLWSTATATPGPVHLTVQDGGNARILAPSGALISSLGDNYPAGLRAAPQDSLVDPWGYYNRECVSFAAWRTLETDHVTVYYAGSAYQWAGYAKRHGFIVDTNPAPGSVAWTNAGKFGHVAMVERVLGPYLVVEEYNYVSPGTYSHRVVLASAFKKFLHFELPPTTTPSGPSASVGPGATVGSGS